MTIKKIFNHLDQKNRMDIFDWFGIIKPNPHLKCEFIEDSCYTQANLKIYFTPKDFFISSLADLISNQSFCKAWWGNLGLGWWCHSHITFQILRDGSLKEAFEYMWKTKI